MVKYIADRSACWLDGYKESDREYIVEVNKIVFDKLMSIVEGMSYMQIGDIRKYNDDISLISCVQSFQDIFKYNPDKIKLD